MSVAKNQTPKLLGCFCLFAFLRSLQQYHKGAIYHSTLSVFCNFNGVDGLCLNEAVPAFGADGEREVADKNGVLAITSVDRKNTLRLTCAPMGGVLQVPFNNNFLNSRRKPKWQL